MSKDELRRILKQRCTESDDHDAENCRKCAEMYEQLSAHVQREIAAFAEQAAQTAAKHHGVYEWNGLGIADEIRSLSPKPFAELVRDAVLEARWKVLSQLRYVWNTKPNHETWDWIASEEEKALHELTEARERIASLEREREARKGGSRT